MEAESEVTQRIKKKDPQGERKKASRASTQNARKPMPVIKAGNVDAKSLHYHKEDILFKLMPGQKIPEVPENTLQLALESFQQPPLQPTVLDVEGTLKADEMQFKEEHGIMKHTADISPTPTKEIKNKPRGGLGKEEVKRTVSVELQNSQKYSSVVNMGDATSVNKIKIKVGGPTYHLYGEKPSANKQEDDSELQKVIDIEELQGILKKYYKEDALFHAQHFLADNFSQFDDVYVPLYLLNSTSQEVESIKKLQNPSSRAEAKIILPPNNELRLEQVFLSNDQENFQPCKKILLQGGAGSGKTFTLLRLLQLWSRNDACVQQYQLVFYLPLRQLKPNSSIDDLIDILLPTTAIVSNRENITANIKKLIIETKYDDEVLWLLDGGDEIDFKTINQGQRSIIFKLLNKPSVFLSSRFHATLDNVFKADKHLIMGVFNLEQRKEFIRKYFMKNQITLSETEIKTSFLIKFLENNRGVRELCKVPIQLDYLCRLYLENPSSLNDKVTATQIYHEVFRLNLRLYYQKIKRNTDIPISKSLLTDDSIQPLIAFITQLAFRSLKKGEVAISRELIDRHLSGNSF